MVGVEAFREGAGLGMGVWAGVRSSSRPFG